MTSQNIGVMLIFEWNTIMIGAWFKMTDQAWDEPMPLHHSRQPSPIHLPGHFAGCKHLFD